MNRIFITLLFALFATSGLCQSTESPCWKTAMAQNEMNRCADLDARAADADLNDVYQKLLSKLKSDDNAVKKVCFAQVATAMTKRRTAQLRSMLDDKDACDTSAASCN